MNGLLRNFNIFNIFRENRRNSRQIVFPLEKKEYQNFEKLFTENLQQFRDSFPS